MREIGHWQADVANGRQREVRGGRGWPATHRKGGGLVGDLRSLKVAPHGYGSSPSASYVKPSPGTVLPAKASRVEARFSRVGGEMEEGEKYGGTAPPLAGAPP